MSSGYRTCDLRTDIGLHADDIFISTVVGRLGWDRPRVEMDLFQRLSARSNANAALNIKQELITRFDKQFQINKLIKDVKDAYKKAKDFKLDPMTLAKFAYGTLSSLAKMAFIEDDLGHDVNRFYFPSDKYYTYLAYSYLSRGQVQPKHNNPFNLPEY